MTLRLLGCFILGITGSLIPEPFIGGKSDQTITFTPADHAFEEETFDLEATTTSELPITFTANNNKITINGTTATIVDAGKVTIKATQEGNDDFESAEELKTICINPPKPIIGFILEISNTFNGFISETEGVQWYFNGEPIPGSTGQSPSPAEATGDYSVQVTIDGCASPMSDVVHFFYSGLEDEMPGVHVFPNPVNDFLYVSSANEARIELINPLGQSIHTTDFSGSLTLPMSGYSKGVYVLKISSGNKVAFTKFIKE